MALHALMLEAHPERGPVLVAATEGHAEDLGRVPRGVDERGAILLTGAIDELEIPVPVRLPFWQGEAGLEDGDHDFLKKGASVYGCRVCFMVGALGHGRGKREGCGLSGWG